MSFRNFQQILHRLIEFKPFTPTHMDCAQTQNVTVHSSIQIFWYYEWYGTAVAFRC